MDIFLPWLRALLPLSSRILLVIAAVCGIILFAPHHWVIGQQLKGIRGDFGGYVVLVGLFSLLLGIVQALAASWPALRGWAARWWFLIKWWRLGPDERVLLAAVVEGHDPMFNHFPLDQTLQSLVNRGMVEDFGIAAANIRVFKISENIDDAIRRHRRLILRELEGYEQHEGKSKVLKRLHKARQVSRHQSY